MAAVMIAIGNASRRTDNKSKTNDNHPLTDVHGTSSIDGQYILDVHTMMHKY